MLMKPQYFTSNRGRHGGKRIIQFHELRYDGSIKTVDPERQTIRVNKSFGSQPHRIQLSNQTEFRTALNSTLEKMKKG